MEFTGMTDASLVLAHMRRLSGSGSFGEAIAVGTAVSDALPGSPVAAEIATELAWIAFQTGTGRSGLIEADRAIAVWRERGDTANEARARSIRALLKLELGDGDAAAEQALDALQLAQASGSRVALSWALNMVGIVFWYCQQHARAADYCAEAVVLAREAGNGLLAGLWLVNVAGVHQAMAASAREAGAELRAEECFERALLASHECVDLLAREGEVAQRVVCLLNLAMARLSRGEIDEAAALLAEVDALPAVDGDRVRLYRDEVAAELLLACGRHEAALPLAQRGLAAAEATYQFEAVLNAVRQLAEAHEQLGHPAEALAYFKRRHAMEGRIAAEKIQQRARMAETVLGLRRLEAEVADAAREREAIAFSLAELSREARGLAEDTRRDALTGVSNRRHLDEVLAALAPGSAFTLAMIDIDHFKSINDRFSHAVGDTVLSRVAQSLRRHGRAGDFVARYGGEEFTLVMFDADLALGRHICRRLRLALRDLNWDGSLPSMTVTASFGLASSAEASDVQALFALADRRLYAAKRGGRDRVVSRDRRRTRTGTPRRTVDHLEAASFGIDRSPSPATETAALPTALA